MSPKSPDLITRKIHFYRAFTGLDDGGDLKPFDPVVALRHIDQLGFRKRYLDLGDSALCCWVHQIDPPQKFRFGYIRRTGLPLVEKHGGRLVDLDIPDDAGLVEVIHVVVFKNNIIGADFNFHGPRVGRLARAVSEHEVPGAVRTCRVRGSGAA